MGLTNKKILLLLICTLKCFNKNSQEHASAAPRLRPRRRRRGRVEGGPWPKNQPKYSYPSMLRLPTRPKVSKVSERFFFLYFLKSFFT